MIAGCLRTGFLIAGLALAAPALAASKVPDFPVKFGGPFELLDHEGNLASDERFRGRYMLIQFGYTYCPDICPISLDTMAIALDHLGPDEARSIQPIFITVDPERDTPEVLAEYVEHFHPDLIGLTGSEADIRKVTKDYRVHRQKVIENGAPADEYLVDHGSITYLMGPDGGFVTLFPYSTTATFMADAISGYLDDTQ